MTTRKEKRDLQEREALSHVVTSLSSIEKTVFVNWESHLLSLGHLKTKINTLTEQKERELTKHSNRWGMSYAVLGTGITAGAGVLGNMANSVVAAVSVAGGLLATTYFSRKKKQVKQAALTKEASSFLKALQVERTNTGAAIEKVIRNSFAALTVSGRVDEFSAVIPNFVEHFNRVSAELSMSPEQKRERLLGMMRPQGI